MALDARSWNLFGLDLLSLADVWRSGWDEALQWPVFSWLSPQEPVRVLLPDGSDTVRLGASATTLPQGTAAKAVAVVLPDDNVLVRELTMPRLALGELRDALALEVGASSPFKPEQTIWGWRADGEGERLRVRVAVAARHHAAAYLELQSDRLAGAEPELWANAAAPIVLSGFAESARSARLTGRRRQILLALGLMGVLLVGLVATPVLQARLRVFDAQARYSQLEAETAGVVAARNALAMANERAQAIRAHLQERVDVPQLIETLTMTLPDDAYLSRLEVQGRQIRMAGQAANASQLMDALGNPGSPFRDVRAPSPISRPAGADKENFVIEFAVQGEDKAQ